MPAPRRLRPDNFTPRTRTPWGGRRIGKLYKPWLELAGEAAVVGESWEVSVEPSFPSHDEGGTPLAEIIATDPVAWLGAGDARRFGGQTPLLVKLLDADDNLSLQVHPADGDPHLAADEGGKPEAWVVLHAEPGAGLYLGFRPGVGEQQVARCLEAAGALDELMSFVPVAAGDAFVIDAGTPHAVGAGSTLLEPQRVLPGRRGVTYRYWDWNRRYDASGQPCPDGRPRQLHLAASLAATDWQAPRGAALAARCRCSPRRLADGPLERAMVVSWQHFAVEQWRGAGEATLPARDCMMALSCVGGELELDTEGGRLELRCGQSGVVPAASSTMVVRGRELLAYAVTTR